MNVHKDTIGPVYSVGLGDPCKFCGRRIEWKEQRLNPHIYGPYVVKGPWPVSDQWSSGACSDECRADYSNAIEAGKIARETYTKERKLARGI